MYSELESCLKKGAEEIGVVINEENIKIFIKYYSLLVEENKKYNLTTIVDERDAAIKHFVDSLTCMAIYDFNNKYVADIGSGAGFPGIPLKIMCGGMDIVLTDAVQKKVGFMKKVVQEIDIDQIEVLHCRAEDMGADGRYRGKFDIVLSRAVAPLNVLLEYCIPLLKTEGTFLAMKGPAADEEIEKAFNALNEMGAFVEGIKTVKLPLLGDERNIINVRKFRSTAEKYPRKAGIPSKKPL
jgi:16S rRNA (guanine527-N7)-methyltransferase